MGIILGRHLWQPWRCRLRSPFQRTLCQYWSWQTAFSGRTFACAVMFMSRPHFLQAAPNQWLATRVGPFLALDSFKGQPVLRGSPLTWLTYSVLSSEALPMWPSFLPFHLMQVLDVHHGVTLSLSILLPLLYVFHRCFLQWISHTFNSILASAS